MDAQPDKGFHWPYLIYVPESVRTEAADRTHAIVVVPNNTGTGDDDFAIHEKNAHRSMEQLRQLGDQIGVIVLLPIFPRPQKDWHIYTHALDRDTMLTDQADLVRLDLQLLAMIDTSAEQLKAEGLPTDSRVVILGFSASGMFANRFAFLHPERVKAAAIGSPGGWPIVPVAAVQDQSLRYPIGVADLESIAGKPLNLEALAKIPLLIYMGDQDDNDSVVFRDSYDDEDEVLIGKLFGDTPVQRWPHAEALYREHLPLAKFKLYPGVGHKITDEIKKDLGVFLATHAR